MQANNILRWKEWLYYFPCSYLSTEMQIIRSCRDNNINENILTFVIFLLQFRLFNHREWNFKWNQPLVNNFIFYIFSYITSTVLDKIPKICISRLRLHRIFHSLCLLYPHFRSCRYNFYISLIHFIDNIFYTVKKDKCFRI